MNKHLQENSTFTAECYIVCVDTIIMFVLSETAY